MRFGTLYAYAPHITLFYYTGTSNGIGTGTLQQPHDIANLARKTGTIVIGAVPVLMMSELGVANTLDAVISMRSEQDQ